MSYIMFQQQCLDCKKIWNAAFGMVGTTIIAEPPTSCPECKSIKIEKIADGWTSTQLSSSVSTSYDKCEKRIIELETAIRKHRDERGHNRCWLDDLELYKVLNESINENDFVLPPKTEFLDQCCKYYETRQP